MANYQYKCVPFVASVKTGMFSKDSADTIAQQLASVINSNVTVGWELDGVYKVDTLVSPGCLGKLLGGSEATLPYDIVTFRKSV